MDRVIEMDVNIETNLLFYNFHLSFFLLAANNLVFSIQHQLLH